MIGFMKSFPINIPVSRSPKQGIIVSSSPAQGIIDSSKDRVKGRAKKKKIQI